MFGILQLVVYLPLLNVNFSPPAMLLYEQIVEIVVFELLPTEKFFPELLNLKPAEITTGCLKGENDPNEYCFRIFKDY